jgi:hypothetical protein
MTRLSHESVDFPEVSTRADQGQVISCRDPSTQRRIATQTESRLSSDYHAKPKGILEVVAAVEKALVWTISALLAAVFLIAAASQLRNPLVLADGLSLWREVGLSQVIVSVALMSGAAMLLIPRCAWYGAVGLATFMAGVVGRLIAHNEQTAATVSCLLIALLITACARDLEKDA